jgi:hypothetical protein
VVASVPGESPCIYAGEEHLTAPEKAAPLTLRFSAENQHSIPHPLTPKSGHDAGCFQPSPKRQKTVIPTEVAAGFSCVPFLGTRRHAAEGPLSRFCLSVYTRKAVFPSASADAPASGTAHRIPAACACPSRGRRADLRQSHESTPSRDYDIVFSSQVTSTRAPDSTTSSSRPVAQGFPVATPNPSAVLRELSVALRTSAQHPRRSRATHAL